MSKKAKIIFAIVIVIIIAIVVVILMRKKSGSKVETTSTTTQTSGLSSLFTGGSSFGSFLGSAMGGGETKREAPKQEAEPAWDAMASKFLNEV